MSSAHLIHDPEQIVARLETPGSLHPKLIIRHPTRPHSRISTCQPGSPYTLHLGIDLDDALFVDAFEVADHWGPSSSSERTATKPLGLVWRLDPPVQDLERPVLRGLRAEPVGATPKGSLHVDMDSTRLQKEFASHKNASKELNIPLHARYLEPQASARHATIRVGQHVNVSGHWSCMQVDGTFPIVSCVCLNMASDGRDTGTESQHPIAITVEGDGLLIPTGNSLDLPLVQRATTAVVWLCWAWVMWAIWTKRNKTTRPKRD